MDDTKLGLTLGFIGFVIIAFCIGLLVGANVTETGDMMVNPQCNYRMQVWDGTGCVERNP